MRVAETRFVLHCTCDGAGGAGHGSHAAHLEGEPWLDVVFTGQDEREAYAAARAAGWMLGAVDLCPRHARRYRGTTRAASAQREDGHGSGAK